MKYPNPQGLEIRGLKTWNTEDGGGYQFTLVKDGAAVAVVHNDGNGGCLDIRAASAFGEAVLSELRAHCKTLPHDASDGIDIEIDDEIFLDELVGEHEAAKRFGAMLKRHKKTQTCFRLAADEPLSFRTVKSLNEPAVRAMLDKKYGAGSYEVL